MSRVITIEVTVLGDDSDEEVDRQLEDVLNELPYAWSRGPEYSIEEED